MPYLAHDADSSASQGLDTTSTFCIRAYLTACAGSFPAEPGVGALATVPGALCKRVGDPHVGTELDR